MMTQEIEKSLSEIRSKIAKLGEKQDTLLVCVLGLGRHHILETLDSVLKNVQARLSYIIAFVSLGVALFALGVAVSVVNRWYFVGLTIVASILLVYALVENFRLERRMRMIERWTKEVKDILSDINKLKEYLTSKIEK